MEKMLTCMNTYVVTNVGIFFFFLSRSEGKDENYSVYLKVDPSYTFEINPSYTLLLLFPIRLSSSQFTSNLWYLRRRYVENEKRVRIQSK